MARILILFAHPLFEKSRVHKALVKAVPLHDDITFRDLYELYPDFNINIEEEKQMLTDHDIIIWQHPLYWYSVPPLLKQWIDMVLQFGWAYGPGGEALKGKIIFNAITSGGQEQVYTTEGRNRYTIRQFLAPLKQTARLCHMNFLPPFIIHGTHLLTPAEIQNAEADYAKLLQLLQSNSLDLEAAQHVKYLNELIR